MKIGIGIILYYPTNDEIKRAKNYSTIFSDVYVYDNTPEVNLYSYFNAQGINYYFNNRNDGMSVALNYICKQAIRDGYDFIITMDQDSIITNESLLQIQRYISNSDMSEIGIIAPTIIYNQLDKKEDISNKVETIDWTITSGSAINLSVYNNTDGFDENYFIDRLDYDYCFNLRKRNKKIIRLSWVYLYQELGEKYRGKSEHNAIRNYYMFRNRLYFYNKNIKGLVKYIILLLSITRHIYKILFYESNKKEKFKMLNKAFYDFLHKNMGQFKY
jgi:rhamnosyltransferase